MAVGPEPSHPWFEWAKGAQPARSWPSSSPNIEVDPARLKQVGQAMHTDTGLSEMDFKRGLDPTHNLPNQFADSFLTASEQGGFPSLGTTKSYGWRAMAQIQLALDQIRSAVHSGARYFNLAYRDLGSLVFASGVNYDRAEAIFDERRPQMEAAVSGAAVEHETIWVKEAWQDEDVSRHDAPKVKYFLDHFDWLKMAEDSLVYFDLAAWFADLQQTVGDRAHQLADAWPGETSQYALDALRKAQTAPQVLAYTCRATGQATSRLSEVLRRSQAHFESTVKLGDHEFDDDLPNWMLPSGGGAHDRARDYLRELNQQIAGVYNEMLPKEIEILLPGRLGVPAAGGYHEHDGLRDDSLFWDFLKVDLGNEFRFVRPEPQ
ncbi:hypothetical protein [Streptosporangium sp. NBC_01469]|uniref:hypothetical protein n=1 Tax=Streptosporangium sp. NBC_01469 TaxID=2903898 RepID=UPI002E2CCB74|nr:hypothetical protein [Streptosporangium sp. NBC_01469]